jgi:hypothetical protein
METGKTAKYLKYAIGEIILVVIGILIALQINNWNENQKVDALKKSYYSQLLQDLEKDTAYININIKYIENNVQLYNTYKDEFTKNESVQSLVTKQSQLNPFFSYLKFNTNTITTLESSGDIKLIPKKIRNQLIDLKNLQDIVLDYETGNNRIFLENFMEVGSLGYTPQFFGPNVEKNKKLFSELKVNENLSKIALKLNASFFLKNITENYLLRDLNNMLVQIETLSKLLKEEIVK